MSRDEPVMRVLAALAEEPRQTRPGQWEAHCPGPRRRRGDRQASLSISTGRDGRALLDCHGGCPTKEVVAALGLTMADLFEKDTRRYRVLDGVYHIRRDTRDGKGLSWEREGKPGLAGLKVVDLPLYGADALNGTGAPVIVCEGEKAAQALLDAGYVAVGTVTGADKVPSDETLAVLAGREVWLWPDNDDVGREHMRKIAERLACPPKWIVWPDAPPKGDAADWLAGDRPIGEELAAWLHDSEPVPTPSARVQEGPRIWTADELAAQQFVPPRWAIPNLLPAGLAILAGRPKLGKSWLALAWAICIAAGLPVLRKMEAPLGEALYLALEDGPRRMQERIHLLLGDVAPPAGLHVATAWPRTDEGGLEALDEWLREHPLCRLVVIDTFKRIRPREKGTARLYDLDYDALAPLAALALAHNVAIVVVFHTRKGESNDPLELVSGTLGLSGAADCVLVLQRERGQADASLFLTGRDVEEQDLALAWDHEDVLGWRLLGDAAAFRLSKERQEILDVIERVPGMAPHEIAGVLDKKPGAVRKLLFHMVRDGEVRARDQRYFPIWHPPGVTVTAVTPISKSVTPPPGTVTPPVPAVLPVTTVPTVTSVTDEGEDFWK